MNTRVMEQDGQDVQDKCLILPVLPILLFGKSNAQRPFERCAGMVGKRLDGLDRA